MKVGFILILALAVAAQARSKRPKRQVVATLDKWLRSARPAADKAYDWTSGKAKEYEPVVRTQVKNIYSKSVAEGRKRLSKREETKVSGNEATVEKVKLSKRLPTIARLIHGFYLKHHDSPLIANLVDIVYEIAKDHESKQLSGTNTGADDFVDDAQTLATIGHVVSRLSDHLKQNRNNELVKTVLKFAEAVIKISDEKSLHSKSD